MQKWLPTEWKKIVPNPTYNRRLNSEISKALTELNNKPNNQIKNLGTYENLEFSTKESHMEERQLKKCSTSFALREMQIKMTL